MRELIDNGNGFFDVQHRLENELFMEVGMKYIVPAESMVWDLKSDWFREHESDVIVICHTTKTNEECEEYEIKIPAMFSLFL